jgi:uncharacterized spore protein YtfJ
VSKEPINTHKASSKKKSEKFMKKILDMVNQNVQDILKKFQDTKNKKHEKTQNQMNSERTSTNTKMKQRTL